MKKRLIDIDKSREILIPEILNENECKIGAEIGVFKGEFSNYLLNNWDGKLFLIDPWRPLGDEYDDISNHKHHLDTYQKTIENIKGFENRSFMMRGLSEELSFVFQDNFLDFVYIDGNHAYDFVKKDINLWWNKIKHGGFLMGHDYLNLDWYENLKFASNGKDKYIYGLNGEYRGIFGVNPAVDEFCEKHNLDGYQTNDWYGSFIIEKI